MKNRVFLILIIVVSILSACELLGSKSENTPSEDLPLTGTSWWLQAFQDEKGKRSNSTMDDIKLVFTESDTLQGKALHKTATGEVVTANSYFAIYSVDHSSLDIQNEKGATTLVGGPSGSRYTEYLAALDEALTYKIQGNRLMISYGENGHKALLFKAGEKDDFPE